MEQFDFLTYVVRGLQVQTPSLVVSRRKEFKLTHRRTVIALDNPLFFTQDFYSRGCGARGDLGQLAPRKKLLKSCRVSQSFSETLLALFGTEGFFFLFPPRCPFRLRRLAPSTFG